MAEEDMVAADPDTSKEIREYGAEGSEAGGKEASDADKEFEGKTSEELRRMVQEERAKARGLQSVHDRHYNEFKTQLDELRAGMAKREDEPEAIAHPDPEQVAAQDEAFVKEWTEKIELDHGKNTIAFVRGCMHDAVVLAVERAQKIVEERLGPVASRVQNLDPDYRQNQARVDELVTKYGMPREKAVIFAKEEGARKAVERQPDKAKVPGASRDGERRVSAAASDDPVPGDFARFLEMSNLGEEFKALNKKEARRG
jgi:hypothetical protein